MEKNKETKKAIGIDDKDKEMLQEITMQAEMEG